MNGVHDLGGMQGMGLVQPQPDEPVFHMPWESRVFALNRAMGAWGKRNLDASRHQRELIPPADYLRMSYYERFLAGLEELMVKHGLVSRTELASGKPDPGSQKQVPLLTADQVPMFVAKGSPATRDVPVTAGFHKGQSVRGRTMNPIGHTRIPRYVRGRIGSIERDHGVFVFPDTRSAELGDKPQHVYSVRFASRELWGPEASPRDAVYVDLWEDYLEPA